jgi:hypothetical protein
MFLANINVTKTRVKINELKSKRLALNLEIDRLEDDLRRALKDDMLPYSYEYVQTPPEDNFAGQ